MGQPAIAIGITVSAIAAQASQATGRHRREGSAPVGNSSSKNVKVKTMPGGHAQVATHAAKAPRGIAPFRVISA